MDAPQELEKLATNHALEAVRLDKQSSRGMAITMYQKAIENLLKLVQLYPEYNLNKIYIQRAIAYQERIKALQGTATHIESQETIRKTTDNEKTVKGERASYDELIVKEKPSKGP